MPLILALLALAAPQNAACTIEAPVAARRAYDAGKTFLRSGKGLWIGGKAFLPSDIIDAKAQKDRFSDADTVGVQLSESGQVKFAEAQRCRIGQPIEISFDGKLVSTPVLSEEIKGLNVQITIGFNPGKAEAIARTLRGGRP